MGAKPIRIRFNKMDEFAGTRYLLLFAGKKYDSIYNKNRYLVGVIITFVITFVISNIYAKIKIDSYVVFLPLEKTLTFINVIILIISVWIKMNYKMFTK